MLGLIVLILGADMVVRGATARSGRRRVTRLEGALFVVMYPVYLACLLGVHA